MSAFVVATSVAILGQIATEVATTNGSASITSCLLTPKNPYLDAYGAYNQGRICTGEQVN